MYQIEEWRNIEGYDGRYQISNLGNVRATDFNHTGKVKVMRISIGTHGYPQISLSKNNKKKTFKIHKLVADAFIPNPFNLPDVNHRDENKQNNCASNLERCTKAYNNRYGTRILRTSQEFRQYDLSGNLIRIWKSGKDIEREEGYDRRHINRCCNGRRPTAYGYIWKRVLERGKHFVIK